MPAINLNVCYRGKTRRQLLGPSLSAFDPERKYGDDVYVTLIAAKRWGRSGAKRCDRLRRHDRCKRQVQKRVAKRKQQTQQQRHIEAGLWLRRLRQERGISQRELADKVGVEVYTLISQFENGRGVIPQDWQLLWADALKVEPREFVRRLASYYDPRA